WLATKNRAEKEEKKARKLKNDEKRLAKKLNKTKKNKGKSAEKNQEKKISSPKDEIVSGKAYTIVRREGKKVILTTNHCRVCGAKGAEIRSGICAKCYTRKTVKRNDCTP
ncbi:MAG: hypothetical protein J6M27_14870, partial [Lachnospiraceae bacterium]|nr:hypothetical protein [Lachnospiraceae bacterium]